MQSPRLLEDIKSRAEVEMIRITQNNLCTDVLLQFGNMDGFDRALRPDGHKDGGFDDPVIGRHYSGTRLRLRVCLYELEFHAAKLHDNFNRTKQQPDDAKDDLHEDIT
jgi:hypothetical protein